MKLEELEVYNLSMDIGERVWSIVVQWDYFAKDTMGKQLVRAVDSIASNLSEGFGRYHFRERTNFCYYSRGSLFESRTRLKKAHSRNLINDEEHDLLNTSIRHIGVKLNNFINSIKAKR